MDFYDKLSLVLLGMIGGEILRILISLVKEEFNLFKYRKRQKKQKRQALSDDFNELLTEAERQEEIIDYVLSRTSNLFAMVEKLENEIKKHENDSR